MVQVPYVGYSTANPLAPDTPEVHEAVTGSMFGENIGAALKSLGGSEEQVGGELATRAIALQDLNNENNARAAQTEYAKQSSILHAQFGSQLGTNASPQALTDYIKAQSDLRDKIRSTLGTENAQIYYDRDTLPFMQRNVYSAAGHAEDQMKEVTVGTAKARLDTLLQTGWNGTPGELDQKIKDIEDPIHTIAGAQGLTPEQVADMRLKTISSLSMHQIEEKARTDPQAALQMLDANQKLDPNDPRRMGVDAYEHALDFARGWNVTVGSEKLAKSIYDPDRPMSDMEADLRKQAPALAHDDPRFEDAGLRALRRLGAEQKSFEASDRRDTYTDLTDKVIANPNITMQQIRSDPKLEARIQALPAADKAKIIGGKWLAQVHSQVTYEEQQSTFREMYGLAKSMDPADRERFLSTDPLSLGLDMDKVKQLNSMRNEVVRAGGDPGVDRAIHDYRIFNQEGLTAAGVVPGTTNFDKDAQARYNGAMAIAIDEWRQEHKGQAPTYKDVTEVIGPSAIQNIGGPPPGAGFFRTWFGFQGHTAFSPTSDEINEWAANTGIVSEIFNKTGAAPTDYDLKQAFLRSMFQKLYNQEKPSGVGHQ